MESILSLIVLTIRFLKFVTLTSDTRLFNMVLFYSGISSMYLSAALIHFRNYIPKSGSFSAAYLKVSFSYLIISVHLTACSSNCFGFLPAYNFETHSKIFGATFIFIML